MLSPLDYESFLAALIYQTGNPISNGLGIIINHYYHSRRRYKQCMTTN